MVPQMDPAHSARSGPAPWVLALPGVSLGVVGATHPAHLTPETAHHWWLMHVAGLVVFPLVGVALASLVWRRRDLLAVAVMAGAAAFAWFYTALDVVSGIAAGWVTDRLDPADAVPRPEEVRLLFQVGGRLGEVGEWGLALAAIALTVDVVRRAGAIGAVPGALLLAGTAGVVTDHIFWPWGSLGAIALGLGTAAAGQVLRLSRSA